MRWPIAVVSLTFVALNYKYREQFWNETVDNEGDITKRIISDIFMTTKTTNNTPILEVNTFWHILHDLYFQSLAEWSYTKIIMYFLQNISFSYTLLLFQELFCFNKEIKNKLVEF